MLRTEELASLRADVIKNWSETGTLQRKTVTPDGMGTTAATWTDIATDVKCAVAPIGTFGKDLLNNVGLQDGTGWTIRVGVDVDIQSGDRFLVRNMILEVNGVTTNTIASIFKTATCARLS